MLLSSTAQSHVSAAALSLAIPTDPASVFVYVLILVAGIFIWRGGRGGPARNTEQGSDGEETEE
jgi:hypothetical protein